jgi:hypothetical protein
MTGRNGRGVGGARGPGPGPGPVDGRLVELLAVLAATAIASTPYGAADMLAGMLAVPALAVYAGVLFQARPSPGARVASLVVLVTALAVLPGLHHAVAFDHDPTMHHGHDGGVAVTDLAVRALLDGRDPYTESYAELIEGMPIFYGDRLVDNPIMHRYPYWPATLFLQVPVQAPLLWAGVPVVDARYVYIGVLLALCVGMARWSLRVRGDLLLAAAVALNPLVLSWARWGTNDVLAVGALALMGWALHRRRIVLAGLALGLALAGKLLVAPAVALFVVWLARRVRDRELDLRAAVGAAAAAVLPVAVTAVPFLLWHPAAFLDDAVLYHLGASAERFPLAGQGLPSLLHAVQVIRDPMGTAPAWSTTLPTVVALAAGAGWLWRRGRGGPQAFLLAATLVTMSGLWFSRSFMGNYWQVPMTLLALAVVAPWPAGASPAAGGQAAPDGQSSAAQRRSLAGHATLARVAGPR